MCIRDRSGFIKAGFPTMIEEEINDLVSFDEYLISRPEATFVPVSYTHLDVYKRQVNNTVVFTLKQRKKDKEELIKLEEEVIVSNADTMKSIIELLDYAPVVQVNKERISCHHKSFEINIDSVENLGIFVEVESISDGNPDEILKEMLDLLISFGISEKDIERKGYDTLMYQAMNQSSA